MKHTHLWLLAIICVAITYCTKHDAPHKELLTQYYVDSAKDRLKVLLPKDHFEKINVDEPDVIRFEGDRMAVRFWEKGSDQKRFVLMRSADGKFTGVSADVTGLRLDISGKVSGKVFITDLVTQSERMYEVANNRVSGVQATGNDPGVKTDDPPTNHRSMISTPDNPQNLDDFVLQGYTTMQLYYSLYWLFAQNSDFTYCYTPERSYLSGSYTTNFSDMEIIPVVDSPDHPIYNVQEELKCFTITGKATYTVTVNVNQPLANTRNLVNPFINHQVGHTYLTLQEQLSDGRIVARNVGFYPKHSAKAGNTIDQATFGDDSYTTNSISLKISVTSSEFNEVINNIKNQENYLYDLNNFNCTNSALSALHSINILLPSTIKSTVFFRGNNPADLGQDLRQLNLKEFSSQNGGRKVIRTISEKNINIPVERQGEC